MLYISECKEYINTEIAIHIDNILSKCFCKSNLAGKSIFIKVNGLTKATADKAMTTHPSLVEATASWFISKGCSVRIGDNPAGDHEESWLHAVYRAAGFEEVAQRTGSQLGFDRTLQFKESKGELCNGFHLCAMACNCDVVINIAKLKTHEYTRFTGCVKNMFGTLPAVERKSLHSKYPDVNDFSNMLVDLYECVRPQINILDAIVGMEGPGPSAGNPKNIGVIIASDNAHDVDYIGARIIGLGIEDVKTLSNADRRGLITVKNQSDLETDIEKYRVKDYKLPNNSSSGFSSYIPKPIRRFINNQMKNYPSFDLSKCVSCGICVKNCPQGALVMKDKPQFNKGKCICCYCCQEMCPQKAISVKVSNTSRCLQIIKRIYRKIR